ncbi:hypothetical protein Q7P37_008329 [Cladosporium fusiforme]
MPDTSEDLTRLMSNVTLAQPTHASARDGREEQERSLDREIRKLASITSELGVEAIKAQTSNQDSNVLVSRRVADIGSLLKRSAEIARISHDLGDATIEYIMSQLRSFHDGDSDVRKLFSHFESEVKAVIKDAYEDAGWDQGSMVRILETCHIQATHGALRAKEYFALLYETCFQSPYDPEYESEAYYDHEERLQLDAGYAEAYRVRNEHSSEARRKSERRIEHAWIGSWVQMLHRSRGGPTLFWSHSGFVDFEDLPDTPRYLFRAFDAASSGESNSTVVASTASKYRKEISRTDLLSLGPGDRAERLCAHLNKKCFGEADHSDDLMSWSSSLLFVLQYAIWRCSKGGRSPAEVYICVVDTTRFPRGQFARDTWLLEQGRNGQDANPKVQNVMGLRQRGYDNGEYLSQGFLVHQNRSKVVTLDQMIQSGLYELYPEFDDPRGKEQWTNRVRDLRTMWANSKSTSHEELYVASRLATKCFQGLQPSELAIHLLMLRNRELRSGVATGVILPVGNPENCRLTNADTRVQQLEWFNNEPDEVQRSMRAIRAASTQGARDFLSAATCSPALVRANLKEVFSCV